MISDLTLQIDLLSNVLFFSLKFDQYVNLKYLAISFMSLSIFKQN